jgi:dihydrofolate reductase
MGADVMGKVIVGMTVSLDGFVNDRNGSVERLYPDFEALHKTEALQKAIENTGAVIMGRRAFDMAQGDMTDYEFQTPIFVLTHHPPTTPIKGENDKLRVYFVDEDIKAVVEKAKAAAGDKDVTVVGGPDTFQQCMNAGVADELQMDIAPVLLGSGQRLLENIDTERVKLELIGTEVMKPLDTTKITYRIVK